MADEEQAVPENEPTPEISKTVDNLEAVPEFLRDHYSEGQDGKYHLDEITALKNTAKNAKAERATAQNELKALKAKSSEFDGVDVEEYQALKAERDAREEKIATDKGEFDKVKAQIQEKAKTDVDAANARADAAERKLDDYILGAELTKALVAADATEEGHKLLPGQLIGKLGFIEVEGQHIPAMVTRDGDGVKPIYKDGEIQGPDAAVALAMEQFPSSFKGTGASGGGTPTSANGGAESGKFKPIGQMSLGEKVVAQNEMTPDEWRAHVERGLPKT